MNKLSKDIRHELLYVAVGLAVSCGLICGVFALLGRFNYTVLLGALWGSVFAFLNLFLLARRVQRLADGTEEEQALAKQKLKSSYLGRIMLMAFAIIVGILVPWFHYIAVVVPFLVTQPVMLIRRSIVSARAKRSNSEKGES